MDYFLAGRIDLREQLTPIDEVAFNRVKTARQFVLTVVQIEEKFGMLLENYREYEETLLDVSLRFMVFADLDYASGMQTLFLTSRRILNLLTGARLYLDQVQHDLSSLYGSQSEQLQKFRDAASAQYDARLGYRTMEALRNFMQHRSLPVRTVTLGWHRRVEEEGDLAVHHANPELDLEVIEQDGNFKPSVLAELKAANERPNVKILVRDYLEGLSHVQAGLRKSLDEDTAAAEQSLRDARAQFAAANGEPRVLTAIATDGGRRQEEIYLGSELLDHRARLRRRYSATGSLTRKIVSSES